MMAVILFFFAPFFVPALLIAFLLGLILCTLLITIVFLPIKIYITKSDTAKSGWKPKLICRDLLLVALSCATIYAVGRAAFFPYKSLEEIFEEDTGLTAPQSLRLLDQDQDHEVTWLHFQVSPADLKGILKEGKYTEDHKDNIHMFEDVENPPWWKAEEMPGTRIYVHPLNPYAGPDDGNMGKQFLFVNSRNNEVYYRYIIPNWDEKFPTKY